MNIPGFGFDNAFQIFGGFFHSRRIAKLIGIHQLGVGIAREFGVDWQPDRSLVIARQLDREFHTFVSGRFGSDVFLVLLRCQNLFEDRAKLYFTENTTRFDVGEDLLEITHPGCQILHLAETLVDLFEPLADQLEGLTDAFLQRLLEFFIDGLPHLFELLLVVLIELPSSPWRYGYSPASARFPPPYG